MCLACPPVPGGLPWQLLQESVAVGDQVAVPWQELAQLRFVAFQPALDARSRVPLRCVAALAVVEL